MGSSDLSLFPPHARPPAPHRSKTRTLANFDDLIDIALSVATRAAEHAWTPGDSRNDQASTTSGGTRGSCGSCDGDAAEGEANDRRTRPWAGCEVSELRLENMKFAQQVEELRRTDVLVGQYGTGEE